MTLGGTRLGLGHGEAVGVIGNAHLALQRRAEIRAQRLTDARTVRDVLGFDPLELLSSLLRRSDPESEVQPEVGPDPE